MANLTIIDKLYGNLTFSMECDLAKTQKTDVEFLFYFTMTTREGRSLTDFPHWGPLAEVDGFTIPKAWLVVTSSDTTKEILGETVTVKEGLTISGTLDFHTQTELCTYLIYLRHAFVV